MKKYVIMFLMFGSANLFGWTATENYFGNNINPLQSGTTAAFNVYLTSANTSGAVTGTISVIISSLTITGSTMTLSQVCSASGGASTTTVNLGNASYDTTQELVNYLNTLGNWTASIPAGVYINNPTYCLALSTSADTNEGLNTGLQGFGATANTAKSITLSTGSANAKTLYLNGTVTQSLYFAPVGSKRYYGVYEMSVASTTSKNSIMSIYEGDVSTNTNTLLSRPITTTNDKLYNSACPLTSSNGKAVEYRVTYSTWVTPATDYLQIHLQKGE